MTGDYLTRLIGGTVTDAWDQKDDEFGEVTVLRIEKPGKVFACWVMMDPEGNGPGFLNVQETELP